MKKQELISNSNTLSLKGKITRNAKKIGGYLYSRRNIIIPMVAVIIIMTPTIVFADDGDTEWKFLTDLISKWGKRIGGALALIGGIEFGLGWKDDRADQRTQGLRMAVSGLIVLAVCASASTFLK